MSNSNSIFAIAAGTQTSAVSYDGTSWSPHTLPTTDSWGFIGGQIGKFLYYYKNTATPFSKVIYSIADNVHWKAGPLPTTQTACLVAIADGDATLYNSTDGVTFTAVPTLALPLVNYTITAAAVSTSLATFTKFNVLLFKFSAIATATSAGAYALKTSFYRTIAAKASSIASIFTKGNSV